MIGASTRLRQRQLPSNDMKAPMKSLIQLSLVATLTLLCGCQSPRSEHEGGEHDRNHVEAEGEHGSGEASDEHESEPGSSDAEPIQLAPFPYKPEQIRASNSPGSTVVFMVENQGLPPSRMSFEFGDTDGEWVSFITRVNRMDGTEAVPPDTLSVRWSELRDHASFPADATTRSEVTITVPIGTHEAWLYQVEEGEGVTSRYWFSKKRAGPPLLVQSERAGIVFMKMEMIEESEPQ
ncbi:MAG: hypothetical protein ACI835_001976 [Planctomycetota bacterium]